MRSFKSVNMIIALVWLYFAFTASVLFNNLDKPNTKMNKLEETQDVRATSLTDEAKLGKVIFRNNCASCHDRNMTSDLTGPALKGVSERWASYPKEDLYNWVRNSEKLIAAKHPRALEIAKAWDNDKMNSFEHLSNEDITNILEYIER